MWSFIWHTFFFDPIYNGLVFFIDIVPGGDVGLAIIATTVVVKVLLLPLSLKAAKTQKLMRELEPKLKEVKEKFKDKREEMARATMDVYKEAGMNPFAGILLTFLQIPIIIALYLSVYSGGGVALPEINMNLLYSFVSNPGTTVDMMFLGLIDMAGKSLLLAILAGVTQFVFAWMSLPKPEPKKAGEQPNFKEDFARSMNVQMRYVMPLIIGVVAYTISASIGLYFVVGNLVMIAQEFVIRKHR
jgi:YidC/Oxa1 family membrane protein insertase